MIFSHNFHGQNLKTPCLDPKYRAKKTPHWPYPSLFHSRDGEQTPPRFSPAAPVTFPVTPWMSPTHVWALPLFPVPNLCRPHHPWRLSNRRQGSGCMATREATATLQTRLEATNIQPTGLSPLVPACSTNATPKPTRRGRGCRRESGWSSSLREGPLTLAPPSHPSKALLHPPLTPTSSAWLTPPRHSTECPQGEFFPLLFPVFSKCC